MKTRCLWFSFGVLLLAPAVAALAADTDLYGDPLPEGAKARIGTARLRMIGYPMPILSPDGKTLYAQTNRGLQRLDPATGSPRDQEPMQSLPFPAAFSADGKRAVNVNYDSIGVTDMTSGKAVAKVKRGRPGGESPAALSADGKTLAVGASAAGAPGEAKKEPPTILIWDVDADKEIKKIEVPWNQYANVALSADGKTVAGWGSFYDPNAKPTDDPNTNPTRLVIFWDAATGKEVSKFRVRGYMPGAVTFSPDNSVAAVSDNTSTIDLVDPKTGASKQLLLGRSGMGRSTAFSPDGKTVWAISDNGSAQSWSAADGSRLSTSEPAVKRLFNARLRVLSGDKAIVLGVKGSAVEIWEVPSGKLISPEGGHTAAVRGVAVTADNKYVITSAEDGTIRKWELATGKPAGGGVEFQATNNYGGPQAAALFNPDATRALINDVGGLGVYDVATGVQQYVIPTTLNGYSSGHFTGDGSKVVTAAIDYGPKKLPAQVAVWDVATAKRQVSLELAGYGAVSAALTPDGKHLITAGQKPGEKGPGDFVITAWDAATGKKAGEHTGEGGYSTPHVAAAPDNKTAVVVTSRGSLVSFDIASGKPGKTLEIGGKSPGGTAPVFSPDGKKLAIACQPGFIGAEADQAPILVLDWPSGEVKHTFKGAGGVPAGMVFSPDGKWLVTGSPNTTATVWDLSK